MSENEMPNQNSGCSEQPMDYLSKAAEACAAGDLTLGMHLYLAAYEKAAGDPATSTGVAVAALREAWHLACDLKERSMAEHVFEKLEPYLTRDEISECATALQNLALDRLEEYGFSREDLEDMAEAISQDFMGVDGSVVKVEHITIPGAGMFGSPDQLIANVDVEVKQVEATEPAEAVPVNAALPENQGGELADEQGQTDSSRIDEAPREGSSDKDSRKPHLGVSKVFNPYNDYPASSEGASWRSATNVGSGWNESIGLDGTTVLDSRFEGFSPVKKHEQTDDEAQVGESDAEPAPTAEESKRPADATDAKVSGPATPKAAPAAQAAPAVPVAPAAPGASAASAAPAVPTSPTVPAAPEKSISSASSSIPSMPDFASVEPAAFNYGSLVGYDEAVSIMRDYGFGLQHDRGFVSFVNMLNEQHGLNRMPAADTMLFRAPAIEDATRFVDATIGELGLPALRMSMEEGVQGMPVLCVTTDGNNRPRMNRQQNRFQGPAVLVIDELDMWRMPEVPENVEGGMNAFVLANMTRGAREAVNLIRSAVEDPDVFVLATSSMTGEVDPFFYEVLEPLTIVDIGNPNDKERGDIWAEIMQDHPSTRGLDAADLVRFSAGMARYDIYIAAREAVEEAYKTGLVQRGFVPVTSQNMLDKLASCQPFDSEEYRALEDRVVSDFVNSLDDLERLLGGAQD